MKMGDERRKTSGEIECPCQGLCLKPESIGHLRGVGQ